MEEKQYFIRVGKERIPVDEALLREYRNLTRQQKYQDIKDWDNGLLYYDAWDSESIHGADVCVDYAFDTEELAIAAIEAEKLWNCIEDLHDEYQICRLTALGYSEREIAKMNGVTKFAIHKRKLRLFQQLRGLVSSKDIQK